MPSTIFVVHCFLKQHAIACDVLRLVSTSQFSYLLRVFLQQQIPPLRQQIDPILRGLTVDMMPSSLSRHGVCEQYPSPIGQGVHEIVDEFCWHMLHHFYAHCEVHGMDIGTCDKIVLCGGHHCPVHVLWQALHCSDGAAAIKEPASRVTLT